MLTFVGSHGMRGHGHMCDYAFRVLTTFGVHFYLLLSLEGRLTSPLIRRAHWMAPAQSLEKDLWDAP